MARQDNSTSHSETPALSRAEIRAREEASKRQALKRQLLLSSCAVALVLSALISFVFYEPMVAQKSAANLEALAEQETQNRANLLQDYWRTQAQTLDRLASNQDIIDSLTPTNPA